MSATFGTKLTDLIGGYAAKINSAHITDLINAAIAEVTDSVPPELLLKYAVAPITLNNGTRTWTGVEGNKVLLVTRKDTGSVDRTCELVGIPAFSQAQDTDSIYNATSHTPVFCLTTAGGATVLDVKPITTDTETASIYYFNYPTAALVDSTHTALGNLGIPAQLLHAIALRTATTMLQAYLSDAIQDDEDQEIVAMLQAQIGSLASQYGAEMLRFTQGTFTQGEGDDSA